MRVHLRGLLRNGDHCKREERWSVFVTTGLAGEWCGACKRCFGRSKVGLTILGVEVEIFVQNASSVLLADGLDPASIDLRERRKMRDC